eukprot:gene34229-biopygen21595
MEVQIGVAVKGGVDIGVHTVQAALDRHPGWVCIKADARNAFNAVHREAVFEAVERDFSELWAWTDLCYGVEASVGFRIGSADGSVGETVLERVQEGQPEVVVLAYLDDVLLMGPLLATAGAYDAYVDGGGRDWPSHSACKVGGLLAKADTGFLAEEMPGARGELDFINILGEPVGKPEVVTAEMLRKVEEMHGLLPTLNEVDRAQTNARGAPGLAVGGWPSLALLGTPWHKSGRCKRAGAFSDGYREDLGAENRLPYIRALQTAMQKLSEAVEEIEEARG